MPEQLRQRILSGEAQRELKAVYENREYKPLPSYLSYIQNADFDLKNHLSTSTQYSTPTY